MILSMARVRILGPRDRLAEMVRVVQDAGTVHLVRPRAPRLRPVPDDRMSEEEGELRSALEDVEAALAALPGARADTPPPEPADDLDPSSLAGRCRRVRRRAEELAERRAELDRRSTDLARFLDLFRRFEDLLPAAEEDEPTRNWFLVLRTEGESRTSSVREALGERLGRDFDLTIGSEQDGARAAVLRARPEVAPAVEEILASAGVDELDLPAGASGATVDEAVDRMRERRRELREELRRVDEARDELGAAHGRDLRAARAALRDRLARIDAVRSAAETELAFVLEGWVPQQELADLEERVASSFGESAALEEIATEQWRGEQAPVALSNPRLIRPFEAVTRMLPLPSYGSMDPTPFVAVFFPMFFGIVLGDVAYGLALAGVAAWLHRASEPESTLRSVAEVGGACAAFTVLFGLVYGELLGDLGHQWLGLEPLVFDREEALIPFLALALALGVVHVTLGLILGAISAFRDEPRQALGRGLSAVMVLLVTVALLAAVQVLPRGFFTPAVVTLLVAFPVLVFLEGVLAPVELISTLGNVLSYARIMALGTASVVMAVVANRLVGALGGVLVGALFGLLFHLVNFALGIFGPTIHGLRLHYVEFFDKFYSPGGERYRPLRHAFAEAATDAPPEP